jgi:hypothetical protein
MRKYILAVGIAGALAIPCAANAAMPPLCQALGAQLSYAKVLTCSNATGRFLIQLKHDWFGLGRCWYTTSPDGGYTFTSRYTTYKQVRSITTA